MFALDCSRAFLAAISDADGSGVGVIIEEEEAVSDDSACWAFLLAPELARILFGGDLPPITVGPESTLWRLAKEPS